MQGPFCQLLLLACYYGIKGQDYAMTRKGAASYELLAFSSFARKPIGCLFVCWEAINR